MPKSKPAQTLDFELAFKRVRDEVQERPKNGRAFAHNPFEIELVEEDLDGWISELRDEVYGSRYVPGPMETCDFPKGRGLVRPGIRVALRDRVIFTAAVGACLDEIDYVTRWSQGSCDFAVRLNPAKLHEREWFRNFFLGWKEFHDRSLQRADSPTYGYVLTADIAGYFENISIGLLRSDLSRAGCSPPAIALIIKCLNQWSRCPDRGIPQGLYASDLLAKLYLEPFDARLRVAGRVHLRYMDDVRVFARTEDEAQRALVEMTGLLRERGLTLQSHKTSIRTTDEAHEEFDGILPSIEKVQKGYIEEVIALGLMSGDVSLPMQAIDDLAADGEIDPAVLHRAFEEFIINSAAPNKSMLNFLLRRLGKQRDRTAVEECARRLGSNPEFTPSIVLYLQDLEQPAELEPVIRAALQSTTGAIYPYQRYLLVDWLIRNADSLEEETLKVVRQLATRRESPQFVRAVSLQLMGRFGQYSDLDEIETIFKSATDPLFRAQLLSSLGRQEKGRRNGLASRVADEPGLVGRAAALVRR